MSFFDKHRNDKTKATEPVINRKALESFEDEKYVVILNTDMQLIATDKETCGDQIFDLSKQEDKERAFDEAVETLCLRLQNYKGLLFKEACCKRFKDSHQLEALLSMSYEDKYKLVMQGIKEFIPSSFLKEYSGSDEERLLQYIAKTVQMQ